MSTHGRRRRSTIVKGDTVDGSFNGARGDTSVKGEFHRDTEGSLTFFRRMATIALQPLIYTEPTLLETPE